MRGIPLLSPGDDESRLPSFFSDRSTSLSLSLSPRILIAFSIYHIDIKSQDRESSGNCEHPLSYSTWPSSAHCLSWTDSRWTSWKTIRGIIFSNVFHFISIFSLANFTLNFFLGILGYTWYFSQRLCFNISLHLVHLQGSFFVPAKLFFVDYKFGIVLFLGHFCRYVIDAVRATIEAHATSVEVIVWEFCCAFISIS